jgi:peptidoglycan/xylan/chitin deacetylase (PgdA/CDA1 family)
LDFELLWGVRDRHTVQSYGAQLLGARAVVPRLLALFAERGVHATWATVGLLMCGTREEMHALCPTLRPTYLDTKLSPYAEVANVGPDEASDPYHFARSLVECVVATPGQELATHTFSHYFCAEPGQTVEQFAADLAQAVAAARAVGVTLRSIVMPRNQVQPAHVAACRAAGLVAYRGNLVHRYYQHGKLRTDRPLLRLARLVDAYVPLSGHNGLAWPLAEGGVVNVPASRFLRPYNPRAAFLERWRLGRITGDMTRAAQRGELYHLWTHPHNLGAHQEESLAALGHALDHYERLRDTYGMRSLTMAEVADEVLACDGVNET